jgi:hypothetical protein
VLPVPVAPQLFPEKACVATLEIQLDVIVEEPHGDLSGLLSIEVMHGQVGEVVPVRTALQRGHPEVIQLHGRLELFPLGAVDHPALLSDFDFRCFRQAGRQALDDERHGLH